MLASRGLFVGIRVLAGSLKVFLHLLVGGLLGTTSSTAILEDVVDGSYR